jgi:hypothetical protein
MVNKSANGLGFGVINQGIVMCGGNPPNVLYSVESCELWNKDIQLYHCVSIEIKIFCYFPFKFCKNNNNLL